MFSDFLPIACDGGATVCNHATGGVDALTAQVRNASFADVFRVQAFRVLYGAELQSIVGDELARVALAILVYSRTGSASLTALVFALTFLPAMVGGIVLAPLGDRLPRPLVMIGCDLLRAVAFLIMAVPGMPLGALGAVLAVAVFVGPAFSASAGQSAGGSSGRGAVPYRFGACG